MCKAIEDIYEEGREKGIREGREEMCKAIDDIYEEGREAGIREGKEEMRKAIDDIYKEGRENGIKEGRKDERRNTLKEATRADLEKHRAEIAESEVLRLKNLLDMVGIAY